MNTILVIDDDSTIQMLFKQFLTQQGYRVLQAENGKLGMQILHDEQPDLIITDILMPEMDGLEILMAIRKTNNTVPIIAISGGMRLVHIDFLRQAKLFGARYAFEKPVSLEVLNKAVQQALEEKSNPECE